MKFDLIISNPPYNRGLDLKILKEIYELSEKICFVHPAGWLIDNKGKHKLNDEIKDICSHLYYVELFNTYEYFNAFTFVPNAITLFNKNISDKNINVNDAQLNETYTVKSIYDIDLHGNSKEYVSSKKKILDYTKTSNILMHAMHNIAEHNIGHSSIAPSGRNVIIPNSIRNQETVVNYHFKSATEATNFKNYLKTKLVRFCLTIFKLNQNLVNRKNNFTSGAIASVPYMPTYEHPWTDEEVAKELGLTEEELAWAINWIPDYYPDDAEKYAKYKL